MCLLARWRYEGKKPVRAQGKPIGCQLPRLSCQRADIPFPARSRHRRRAWAGCLFARSSGGSRQSGRNRLQPLSALLSFFSNDQRYVLGRFFDQCFDQISTWMTDKMQGFQNPIAVNRRVPSPPPSTLCRSTPYASLAGLFPRWFPHPGRDGHRRRWGCRGRRSANRSAAR